MAALSTFANLSQERQQEILHVALEEFSLNDYKNASLSDIISRLDLAKGSFYRYFENKQSLYFYLLDTCIKTRIDHDSKVVEKPSSDFFELLVQHFRAKILFDKQQPLHSAFLHNVLQENNNEDLGDIQTKSKSRAIEILKSLLMHQVKRGKMRKDIDVDMLAFFVFRIQVSITEFLGLKNKIDFNKRIKSRKPLYDISETEILTTSKKFAELLRSGLTPPAKCVSK